MKTINEYIAQYQNHPEIVLKNLLENVLENIRFLEDIYLSGGKYRHSFSEEFRDAAYSERRKLSIKSSAIHEILRKQ